MARNGAELRTIMILPANSQNPRTIRALPRGIRVPRIPRPGLAAARRGMVRRLDSTAACCLVVVRHHTLSAGVAFTTTIIAAMSDALRAKRERVVVMCEAPVRSWVHRIDPSVFLAEQEQRPVVVVAKREQDATTYILCRSEHISLFCFYTRALLFRPLF